MQRSLKPIDVAPPPSLPSHSPITERAVGAVVQRLAVATDVFASQERVYDLLAAFDAYGRYSEYLEDVTRHGDGGAGTEYEITASWWRLTHTVRSRVTDVDPPERIDWRLVSELEARGRWEIEAVDEPVGDVEPPAADAPVTRVRLVADYDPDSADAIGLPALLSADALVARVTPLLAEEATRVVERVVADLEGESRDVDLEIRRPGE